MKLTYRSLVILFAFSVSPCFAELVTLTIGPGDFPEPSSVSVFVDAGLLGDDEVLSSISGDLVVDLLPTAANPTTAQIVELHAQVDDEIDFRVGGRFLLPSVTVNAGPGEIKVNLVEPGMTAPIDGGQFDQLGNLVAVEGIVNTSVQPEPFELSEQEPTNVDFEAIDLQIDGETVTLGAALVTEVSIPIEVGLFTLSVTVGIVGDVVASGLLPTISRMPGDANDDGTVNFVDFLALSASFGGPGDWTQGDFDGDGEVEFPDFLILSDNYGAGTAISAVPEPTAKYPMMATLFAVLCLRKRRK